MNIAKFFKKSYLEENLRIAASTFSVTASISNESKLCITILALSEETKETILSDVDLVILKRRLLRYFKSFCMSKTKIEKKT